MKTALIHTIRIHTSNGLVTVVHGPHKATVLADANKVENAEYYEVEEWWSDRRIKSRRQVETLYEY